MNHIYRIVLIGGLWRLMCDDKLHSTYTTQGAAKAGMANEQARDEKRKSETQPLFRRHAERTEDGNVILFSDGKAVAILQCMTGTNAWDLADRINGTVHDVAPCR